MATRADRVFQGMVIGAIPGAALWVIGAIVGGEAFLSLGVIGILLGFAGIVIGASVGAGSREQSGSAGRSRSTPGAVIGSLPGVVMLFFATRLGVVAILVGGLIGAAVGGRIGARRDRRSPVR